MTQKLTHFLLSLICLFAITSCGNEEPQVQQPASVAIYLSYPEGISEGSLSNVKISFFDQNTQKTTTVSNAVVQDLFLFTSVDAGFYNITVEADLEYTSKFGDTDKIHVFAQKESTELKRNADNNVKMQLYTNDQIGAGFVLAEIFCAGTKTPQGTNYFADTYFRIYNNSDHVLYADSLALVGSWFNTGMKNQDLNPDIMNEAMTAMALYIIPGSGKDHPIEPGGSILIANNAQNHKYANPNSFDMTKADFEWYDESTNPMITDIDNPDVPNLNRYFAMTRTVWDPNSQGLNAFAIAKIKVDKETYLKDYQYSYTYTIVPGNGSEPFTTNGDCYKVPNEWIIDAVNLSVKGAWQWNVTSPELDRGWTYCSDFMFDDTRYGKSVRRKVASRATDGRAILMDTNNSTDDFDARQAADPFHTF